MIPEWIQLNSKAHEIRLDRNKNIQKTMSSDEDVLLSIFISILIGVVVAFLISRYLPFLSFTVVMFAVGNDNVFELQGSNFSQFKF